MQFMRHSLVYFIFSGILIAISVASLFISGLKPSIDFVGGSLLEIQTQAADPLATGQARELLKDIYAVSAVQPSGESRYIIKGAAINNDLKNLALEQLNAQYGSVSELRFETIGPALSRELLQKTLVAVLLVSLFIMGYIAKQFKNWIFGLSAIAALAHDVIILVGAFSIFGWLFGVEVDVLFVTALLTTLAFSVHDTIVVFDRIRELRARHPGESWQVIADAAVTETLNRSFNNSMTTVIMLAALSLLGGESIRWFAVALLLGVVVGTYSSPFVAVPILTKLFSRKKTT